MNAVRDAQRSTHGLRLTVFPRLHVTLIDCGEATSRQFGGVGVSLRGPTTVLTCQPAASVSFSTCVPLERRTIDDIERVLRTFDADGRYPPVSISLDRMPPQHIGLGTKTAVLLGVARLLSVAAHVDLGPDALTALTGRGGTSGVGTHTFFSGGWVADAGHLRDGARPIGPSSMQTPKGRAALLARYPVTGSWRFHLLLPPGIRRSAEEEISFFRRNSPIPDNEVARVMALVYHGVLPAIVENDLSALRASLAALNDAGFKARELAEQSPTVRHCVSRLHRAGLAAGMSSLGPLVYAVTDKTSDTTIIRSIADECDCEYLGAYSGQNTGARLAKLR